MSRLLWAALVAFLADLALTQPALGDQPYPYGDARNCLARESKLIRFEVLPGTGWDNLRNLDAGTVVSYNYSRCRTSDDGRFLLPDNVNTVPLKTSSVQTYAELIDHWNNYTSATARSINIEAGASFPQFSISGQFSDSFSDVKANMIQDKSYTTRVQIRYSRYTASLQPDSPLSPEFRRRLLQIATDLVLNRTEGARYGAQLLVRDFGTHVVTSVDAGALLVQTEQVNASYVLKYRDQRSAMLAAVSASFFSTVHIGVQYQQSTDTKTVDEYRNSRTSSMLQANGGSLLTTGNQTVSEWISSVDQDLVAVDRAGDPLYYLVTSQTLPELPDDILYRLTATVEDAIKLYYEYNTYRGCTDRDSPNFSFISNVDDGTCKVQSTNLTFGGIYMTCSQTQNYAGDVCGDYRQVNPKTGTASCPEGYQAVPLHSGSLDKSEVRRECHHCWWIFGTCCDDHSYYSTGSYSSYWCAAAGPVPQESGYLFGGLYTDQVSNPLTGTPSCPELFHPFKMGSNLKVCLSDDYELGARYSVPFGGFMSCSVGNPLAVDLSPTSSRLTVGRYPSLSSFLQQSGPPSWPQRCPKGYSQHLADVQDGCAVHYCVQSGALSAPGLPPIRRPPYFRPALQVTPGEFSFMLDAAHNEWTSGRDPIALQKAQERARMISAAILPTKSPSLTDGSGNASGQLSPGTAAGLSVLATLACVGIVTVLLLLRRRRSLQHRYQEIHNSLPESPVRYGATSASDATSILVQPTEP